MGDRGQPPEGVTYFNFFHLTLIIPVFRQIAKTFVEIRLCLVELSPILECGGWGGGMPPKGVTYFNFFLPNIYHSSQ